MIELTSAGVFVNVNGTDPSVARAGCDLRASLSSWRSSTSRCIRFTADFERLLQAGPSIDTLTSPCTLEALMLQTLSEMVCCVVGAWGLICPRQNPHSAMESAKSLIVSPKTFPRLLRLQAR